MVGQQAVHSLRRRTTLTLLVTAFAGCDGERALCTAQHKAAAIAIRTFFFKGVRGDRTHLGDALGELAHIAESPLFQVLDSNIAIF